jgi:hypothetical protein
MDNHQRDPLRRQVDPELLPKESAVLMDAEQPDTAVGASNDDTEIITREGVQLYRLAWSDEGDGPEEPKPEPEKVSRNFLPWRQAWRRATREPERVPRNFLPWRQAWRRAATIASVGAAPV